MTISVLYSRRLELVKLKMELLFYFSTLQYCISFSKQSLAKLSCLFHDPADVGNLISGSSASSKTSLNIWKFTVHILLKAGLENFSITLLACEMSAIVQ